MTSSMHAGLRIANSTERALLWGFVIGGGTVALVNIALAVVRIFSVMVGPVTLPNVATRGLEPAGFAGATFDAVSLTLQDPSPGVRWFLVASALLSSLLIVAVSLIVAWLSFRLLRERPFGRVATWGAGTVAILVFLCGLGGPVLDGMAAQRAVLQLGVEQLPTFLVEVDLAPVGWGLALAVVAAVFEIGQRMQRDADGLV
ncbi:hypothetical protein [Microbacterium sp. VKM Ac-2923]|uniref:hypothetical protein n=1 Tax=Microbacterium sp. VKM Ac-2923 TaxID=2929476 RepID=UPI001FB4ECE6|nr:hypothetical protein [Microbacterium sp. VKM Ac-2923]MCJ1709540.1 hypothetical protein [Microbacterium sp. VKM Ac-2923]